MKSRFAITMVLGLLFAGAVVTERAAAQNAARVDIPFAFSANHQGMEPGCYTVQLQSHTYLTLVDCDTGKVVGLMVRTTNAYKEIDRGSLVFHVSERGYRLSQVRFAFTNMQSDLAVQPKPSRELAKDKGNRTVEIAMK